MTPAFGPRRAREPGLCALLVLCAPLFAQDGGPPERLRLPDPALPLAAFFARFEQRHEAEAAAEWLVAHGTPAEVVVAAIETAAMTATDDRAFGLVLASRAADPSGTFAVPALVRLLGHQQSRIREWAGYELAAFGPKAAPAIPALVVALRTSVREPVERVTSEVRPSDEERTCYHRWAFLGALAMIGPEARSAVPALLDALRTESTCLRSEIIQVLHHVDPSGVEIVDPLIGLLDDREPAVRAAAMRELAKLGAGAAPAVPALTRSLACDEPGVRHLIVLALGSIGEGGPETCAALVAQLSDPDEQLVRESDDALRAMAVCFPAPDVASLARTLRASPDSAEAVRAAYRLRDAGRRARPALSALVAAMHASAPNVRRAAAAAIGAIGPDAAPAVPALLRNVESLLIEAPVGHPDRPETADPQAEEWREAICEEIVHALGHIGPAAASALPLLERVGPFGRYEIEGDKPYFRETIERIAPSARIPLAIVVEPDFVLPAPAEGSPEVAVTIEREPDGAFRITLRDVYKNAMLFAGTWIELFLRRDAAGRPVPTADYWHWTDCGPDFTYRDQATTGSLTLSSTRWGSGRPIQGTVQIGAHVRSFSCPDPFVEDRVAR